MLTMKAKLERKPTELTDLPLCQIEKIIELPGDEFASLAAHPYTDRDYITENRDLMGEWDGAYHCLLALGEGGSDGILIEAEGDKRQGLLGITRSDGDYTYSAGEIMDIKMCRL